MDTVAQPFGGLLDYLGHEFLERRDVDTGHGGGGRGSSRRPGSGVGVRSEQCSRSPFSLFLQLVTVARAA